MAQEERAGTTSGLARPVARIINTDGGLFAYDAYSNRILKLDSSEVVILNLKCSGASDEVIESAVSELVPPEAAPARIAKFNQEAADLGVFQPVTQREVEVRVDHRSFKHSVEHHLRGISLEITEQCNLRCGYCVYGGWQVRRQRTHGVRRMPLATATSAVDYLIRCSAHHEGALALCFYGGEPLMEFECIQQILDHADCRMKVAGRECTYHMTTNGTFLEDERVRRFLTRNDFALLVSLDGPQELHDNWRTDALGRGTYQAIVAGLRALQCEYPQYYKKKVSFNAVQATRGTVLDVSAHFARSDFFQESTQGLRLSSLYGLPMRDREEPGGRVPDAWESVFVRNRRKESFPVDGLGSIHNLMHARLAQRIIEPLPARVTPAGWCVPGGRKLFVTVDGRLGICERMREFVCLGNLEEGVDTEFAAAATEALCGMWKPSCSFCYAQRFCGVCLAQVSDGDGRVVSRDFAEACKASIMTFDRTLSTFVSICSQNPEYLGEMQSVVLS